MENLNNKNWDLIGEKLSSYVPDEYTSEDWLEMEKTLYPPQSFLQILKGYLLPLLFISVTLVTAAFIYFGSIGSSLTGPIENSSPQFEKQEVLGMNASDQSEDDSNIDSEMQTLEKMVSNVDEAEASKNSSFTNTAKNNLASSNSISKVNNAPQNNFTSIYSNQKEKINTQDYRADKTLNTSMAKKVLNKFSKATNKYQNSQTTFVRKENSNLDFARKENLNLEMTYEVTNLLPILASKPLDAPEEELEYNQEMDIDTKSYDSRIRFGITGGLNNSIVRSPEFKVTSRLPFFGIYANKQIANRWIVELGAQLKWVDKYNLVQFWRIENFNQNGLVSFQETTVFYDGYRSLDIPLTFKYRAKNKLWLTTGLRYSYITSKPSSQTYTGSSTVVGGNPEVNLEDIIPRTGFWKHDFGIALGAEYSLRSDFGIKLQWNQGLRDITPDNFYGDFKVTNLNSDLQLSLNYTFN